MGSWVLAVLLTVAFGSAMVFVWWLLTGLCSLLLIVPLGAGVRGSFNRHLNFLLLAIMQREMGPFVTVSSCQAPTVVHS